LTFPVPFVAPAPDPPTKCRSLRARSFPLRRFTHSAFPRMESMRSDADEEGGIMTFENSLRVDFPLRPSTTRDAHATLVDEGCSFEQPVSLSSRVAMSSTRECLTRAFSMRVIFNGELLLLTQSVQRSIGAPPRSGTVCAVTTTYKLINTSTRFESPVASNVRRRGPGAGDGIRV
jgi:hypothetical protein